MSKYATVRIGEYEVPLIGVDKSATEETCAKCKKVLHLSEGSMNEDGEVLCTACQSTKPKYEN